jgi:hypothetical protein
MGKVSYDDKVGGVVPNLLPTGWQLKRTENLRKSLVLYPEFLQEFPDGGGIEDVVAAPETYRGYAPPYPHIPSSSLHKVG